MLYSMGRDQKLSPDDVMKRYQRSVNRSFELYLFNLLFLIKVTEYSKKDQEKKRAKLLPSEDDKRFTAKLYENDLIQSLVLNESLKRLFNNFQLSNRIDEDNTRSIYTEFSKSDDYKAYIKQDDNTEEQHQKVLLALYKHCVGEELFNDAMEDNYSHWVDDKSLIVGAIKKTIKALPVTGDFHNEFRPSTEATVDFGETLLSQVISQNQELLDIIEPTLKNWDADRVAVLDMILLKMALCELLKFPTIPTKVTLNEFVEISKLYSTDKSKDFINGILDRLMKKLNKEGKIQKEGRGLLE